MFFSYISTSYAEITLDKVGSVFRLRGPQSQDLQLRLTRSKSQGGDCQNRPTQDLIIEVGAADAKKWLESPLLMSTHHRMGGPCEVRASPSGAEGSSIIELRISYLVRPNEELQYLRFESANRVIIDQWFEKSSSHKSSRARSGESVRSSAKGKNNFAEVFENKNSWEKILGAGTSARELSTPELDRFRDARTERSLGISSLTIEQRSLELPLLELPLLQFPLAFDEKKVPFTNFTPNDLGKEIKNKKTRQRVFDALNFIVLLVNKEQWLKAQEALRIFEKSSLSGYAPANHAKWWALKGFISLKIASVVKDEKEVSAFRRQALDWWREGTRRTAGSGGEGQIYSEYMLVELVRHLYEAKSSYGVLGALTWAQKYSWSEEAEERFAYLRGISLADIGLYEEGADALREFYTSRSGLSISALSDRRLVPAAAISVGDIYFRLRNYAQAVKEYTSTLTDLPAPKKFSFEKGLYPEMVRQFPELLFNRAEASLRLGNEEQAIKDLRVFLHVAHHHPQIGLAYYRIGDVMELLGGDEEKKLGAWRECVFRVHESLGGKLCNARLAAKEMVKIPKENQEDQFPRLIAEVEDANQSLQSISNIGFSDDDIRNYVNLLLADVFIKTDSPYQAVARLDSLEKTHPSYYMSAWVREYFVTALAGYMKSLLEKNQPQDVVKEYDKRRKTVFLKLTRHDVLYYVAKAYQQLSLFKAASKTLEVAEQAREKIGRQKLRTWEPSQAQMLTLRAEIEVDLLAQREGSAEQARATLVRGDQSDEGLAKAWIRFAQISGDKKLEVEAWTRYEKNWPLDELELRAFARALSDLKLDQAELELFERRVGAWFFEKESPKAPKRPSLSLLVKLAELRERHNAGEKALTLYEYLLTLPDGELSKEEISRSMILYKRGMTQKKLGSVAEARQSFAAAKALSPDSMWGKLATAAEKDMIR